MAFTVRILAKEVVAAVPDESVASACQRMAKNEVGSVAVLDREGKLLGILTERDVAYRMAAKGLDPAKTQVSQVMTRKPQTVQAEDSLERVFEVLSRETHRHLPVMEGAELIGMVSLHDCAKLLESLSRDPESVKRFAEIALGSPRHQLRVRRA